MATKQVAHAHSPLGALGDKAYFEQMFEEGYTHYQFGRGPHWRSDLTDQESWDLARDVHVLWAFYHPEKSSIMTQEFLEKDAERKEGDPEYGPVERNYTPIDFQRHVKENNIKLASKGDLEEVLETTAF